MRVVRRPSRRLAIVMLVLAVLLILAGIYVWQSAVAWQGFEKRLVSERSEYDSLQKQALSGKDAETRLKALRALDDKVSRRSTLCTMNGLYAWQATVIPPLKQGMSDCISAQKRLDIIATPLAQLRDYLDTSDTLRSIVVALVPGENLNESNWAEIGLNRAKKSQSDIKALRASGDGAKLKQQATTLADNLVASWESLIRANAAKDKTAYLGSAASVTKAYTDFAALADTSDEKIKQKVSSVVDAYQ